MKNIVFWSLLCLLFVACRKDQDTDLSTTQDYKPPIIEINVTASVEGIILDEARLPVSEALVSIGGLTELTNQDGLFVFSNIMMDQSGTLLKVEKEGFFNGSTRFFPKDQSKNFTKITLLERQIIGTLDAGNGGEVTNSEGIKIEFPAGSIVDVNNQIYSGEFSVAARWLNPEADNLYEIMPGNLQGVDTEGNEVALISYGMMGVELLDDSGNLLQLGNGQKATLSFPLPTTYLNSAPAEIPLWYFEESTGLWEEEGQATLQGGQYVGEVAHFSFWNCDDPYTLVQLSGRVLANSVRGELIPVANALVKVSTSDLGCGFGYTDQDGYFTGAVPRGVALDLIIKEEETCNTIIYSTSIDALQADKDLGDILIDLLTAQYVEITGSLLDCNSEPLTDGWVQATMAGNRLSHHVDAATFKFAILNCDGIDDVEIKGLDYNTLEEGNPQIFPTSEELNVGDIYACGNILEEFFRINIQGEERIFASEIQKMSENQFVINPTAGDGMSLTFNISPGPITPGTYGQSDILTFSFGGAFDFSGGIPVIGGCSGLTLDCVEFTTFNLTQYTGVIGEKVKGNFSGTVDVRETGVSPTPYDDVPFSCDFALPLTEF